MLHGCTSLAHPPTPEGALDNNVFVFEPRVPCTYTKRSPPTPPADFIEVPPGAAAEFSIDLATYYAMPPEPVRVRYRAYHVLPVDDSDLLLLCSNDVELAASR